MRRLLLALALSLIPAAHATPELYTSYTGFAIPAEPVLPVQETHPSLWFTTDQIPALRERIQADAFARQRWAAVLKWADLTAPIPRPPTATDTKEVIHQYYGSLSIAARAHAVVALLSDDQATAHRDRAITLLKRAYDGPIFELDSKIKGSPVDEIYRGSWLQNYAHAYDCMQPALTAADDAAIRARLALEAQCVYENLVPWAPDSPHNHLSKPAWGLGSIALALSDDPRATAWLGHAIEAANRNTRYFFSGDGLYREGSHYLMFSAVNFVPFLWHYRNVSRVDGFAAFQPVFEAMVATRNSRGWLPNFEDAYLRPTPTHLVAAAYRNTPTYLHTQAPLAEVLNWSYQTADLTPFDLAEQASGFNYSGASWDYPLELDEFLTHDPTLGATAPDAAPNQFLAGGQAVLRTDWEQRGPGQRYLLFQGMAVADNHNHHDQLSFILEAEGQLMASDTGYSRGSYRGSERLDWYATAPAHNTLTFDGQPASPHATNDTPTTEHWTYPGLVVVRKIETHLPVDGARWHRTICWIDSDAYVIIDQVISDHPMAVKAYLHAGRGELTSTDSPWTWTYPADRYGSAAALNAWIIAPGSRTTSDTGEMTYIKGDFATFPYLETTFSSATQPTFTVLQPTSGTSAPSFTVEDRSSATQTAVAITTPHGTTTIAAQPGQAGLTITRASSRHTDTTIQIPAPTVVPWTIPAATLPELATEAPAALRRAITTVVEGDTLPGGDPHDYVSYARYYWPDPAQPDGLPFIRQDGHHNREQIERGDRLRITTLVETVTALAADWHLHRNVTSARRAGEWLRAWYVDSATRMNPNLNYAQVRLGHHGNRGNPTGVLDTRDFAKIVDALRLLRNSPALSDTEYEILRAWFADYLQWLLDSPLARQERLAANNHGTWYFAHVIPLARFLGRDALARELIHEARERIATQIAPDGSQPEEIARVDGLGYSVFNLQAWLVIAAHAADLGFDLWTYAPPTGASLQQALAYLCPFNAAPQSWPHGQRDSLDPGFLDHLLAQADALATPTSFTTAVPLPAPVTPSPYPDAETYPYREACPTPVPLHVFKPEDWSPTDRRPAYVRFFGGGWQHGSPAQSVGWARSAAKLGLVGIAPDYRVVKRWSDANAATCVADARRAFRWIQNHADELGIDPQRIIVGGASAGAHLALWTAITDAPAGIDDSSPPPLYPPAALVLASPPSDTSGATGVGNNRFHVEDPDAYSPLQHLDATMPPVLLFHGEADPLVPFAQSVALHAALIASGNDCEFHPIPGGGHNFSADVPAWKQRVPALQRAFLERLHLLPVTP